MKQLGLAFGLVFGISVLTSCTNEFNFSTENLSTNIDQNSEFAIPLVDASISLDEILTNDSSIQQHLIIDENKFISLQYNYSYAEFPATNFFKGDYSGSNLPYYADVMEPKTINLGFNNLINHGELYLNNPTITVSVINYWNIPTRFKFSEFNYYPESNSPAIPVTGSITTQWITVNQPSVANTAAITDIELNKTNSNIDQVISSLPDHISVGADYETIPGGPYSINPASVDSVTVRIDVPLDLKATDLRLTDTLDFNLSDKLGKDTTVLKSLKLNLIFDNGYPLALNAQIYFADENYAVIDSISNTPIAIPSGKTTSGIVTETTQSMNVVQIENEKINRLLKSKYMIIGVRFNTANSNLGESVKLYSNYALGFKVGALVVLEFKL